MIRQVAFLVMGLLFTVLGTTILAVMLRGATAGGVAELGGMGLLLLMPAVFALLGIVLIVVALRGLLRRRQRRAMPLADAGRLAPATAGAGQWALVDVASEIARRLSGSPCSVHHDRERIEIRWAGDAAQERCELRDAGEGVLSHSDVIESPFEVLRLHRGAVFRAGPSGRGRGVPSAAAFETVDRRAIHRALDEALAVAGWVRAG